MRMNVMMSACFRWTAGAVLALVLFACNVHEYPSVAERKSFRLVLDVKTDLPWDEPYEVPESKAGGAVEETDVRYTVRVYRAKPDGKFGREADTTLVVVQDRPGGEKPSVELALEEGRYRFMVWADYVDEGSVGHKFYDTDDFGGIVWHGATYRGNTDLKDAWYGSREADVCMNGIDEVTVMLQRPLAKYRFIATDWEEFVTKVTAKSAEGADAPTKVVDLSEYRVVITYTRFVPSSFNMFDGRANDARTGVCFEGRPAQLDGTDVLLGFDYVFANEEEDYLPAMSVKLLDKEGKKVAEWNCGDCEIPIRRNVQKDIRGAFLTVDMPGIGVDPDFDGDFNIEYK